MPSTAQDINEAEARIVALEDALASNLGVAEVVTDGVKVRYDRKQAMDELAHWRRRLSALRKRRPLFIGVDLGGAF